MLESTIEKYTSELAKREGALSFKFVSPSQRGVPDRVFIYKGNVCFVEFKTAGGLLSKLQEHYKKKFEEHYVDVYIVRSKEEGQFFVSTILTKDPLT